MAGPTTEVLSDDVKGLRDDLHKVEVALTKETQQIEVALSKETQRIEVAFTKEAQRIEVALTREIDRVEVALTKEIDRVELALTKGIDRVEQGLGKDVALVSNQVRGVITAIKLLIVLTITSISGSIWWGATLTADVKSLEKRLDKFEAQVNTRFDKVDARFDNLEASIAKILEQTKPAAPVTK